MASGEDLSTVQVLYQLSWDHGRLEHPHMIEVQYPSNQDGLRLRDVKKRLTTLRGHGIGQSFSWSYKRNYRNTFIWNDLCDDDVIHPLRGSGEYLMKASERLDTFTNKTAELQQDFRTKSAENVVMKDAGAGCVDTENESKKLPTLSVEQETIDVEKSDFCLSSSDNEVSPRPRLADSCCDTKPVKSRAQVASPTVLQRLQTPSRLTSPTELPLSPGSAKRMWKGEIRKSLFRTSSRNVTTTESSAVSAAGIDVELPEDALLRSKSVTPANLHESKEASTPRRELIRSLWARWTGASGKGKRISSPPQTKQHARSYSEPSHQSTTERIDDSVSLQEEIPHLTQTSEPPASVANLSSSATSALDGDIERAAATPFPQPQESKKEIKVALSVEIPILQVDVPDSPTSDTQGGGPPEAEIDTPKPAIARAKGLPRVRTTAAPRPLPPGFHKGTNDTKPVQTPRRNSSTPLASPPPLLRSLSRDAKRSLSARRRASITPADSSPESKDDSVTSPENRPVKKNINFRERDERPLQPGLSSLDWEKALQDAVANCLPPPNFGDILRECSNCGRTFKPDSLQVHKRGCHPPQYSRAFSARASPMMVRSRAA